MPTMVSCTCLCCQKPFERELSAVNQGHSKYCSHACSNAARPAKGPTMVQRVCARCHAPFEAKLCRVNAGGAKYCSRACTQAGIHRLRWDAAEAQDKRTEHRDAERGAGDKKRW